MCKSFHNSLGNLKGYVHMFLNFFVHQIHILNQFDEFGSTVSIHFNFLIFFSMILNKCI